MMNGWLKMFRHISDLSDQELHKIIHSNSAPDDIKEAEEELLRRCEERKLINWGEAWK
jgi:hypothetical protein